jgi:hypothetical protein
MDAQMAVQQLRDAGVVAQRFPCEMFVERTLS